MKKVLLRVHRSIKSHMKETPPIRGTSSAWVTGIDSYRPKENLDLSQPGRMHFSSNSGAVSLAISVSDLLHKGWASSEHHIPLVSISRPSEEIKRFPSDRFLFESTCRRQTLVPGWLAGWR